MIAYDLFSGIKARKWQYIAVAIISVILVLLIIFRIQMYHESGRVTGKFSIVDILLYWFRGSLTINPKDAIGVDITDQYMFMNIYIAFIIGNYIVKDLEGIGTQILCRTQRNKWWNSKVLWNVITVLSFFVCLYTIIIIICLIHPNGTIDMNINWQLARVAGYDISNASMIISVKSIVALIVIMPVVSALEIAMIQMVISFIVSPIIGYMIIIVQMILCMFYNTFLFPGNGLMFRKNALFVPEGPITTKIILSAIIIWFILYIVGYIYADKFDVLSINKV